MRAILAIDQAFLFKDENLVPLENEGIKYFKNSIDIGVLSVLKEADEYGRKENSNQIEETHK